MACSEALVLAFVAAGFVLAAAQTIEADPIANVNGLLLRVLGPEAEELIHFNIKTDCGELACFTLENDGNNGIVINGTTLVEMASGLNYYMRHYLNVSVAWDRTGGRTTYNISASQGIPPISDPIKITRRGQYSYYANVVTVSYSMVWWDWARWEAEIDWMALSGVNLVLAYTGQEYVYSKVYQKLGLSQEQLGRFFNGPAYLAWSRGQGMAGVGGPLPPQWYKQQWQLQKQIVARQESLGIHSLLPAFQGNVPDDLLLLYPDANISNGWLDCFDPLFTTIADMVMTELIADFGATGFYQADGFFDHSTGPWVDAVRRKRRQSSSETRDSCAFGNELSDTYIPGCSEQCKAFSDLAPAQDACVQQADCTGVTLSSGVYQLRSGLNAAPSPSNESSWMLTNPVNCHGVPASSSDAHARASLVYKTLTKHDPDAVWVYQGWIWLGLDSIDGLGYIQGFTSAVPNGKLIILDMEAESDEIWAWSHSFYNASFIWCSMNNFGGNNGLYGDMDLIVNRTNHAALAAPSFAGIGITMEGIDQNPAYYQLVLDTVWDAPIRLPTFMATWGAGRCGSTMPSTLADGYTGMLNTVYIKGQPHALHHFYANTMNYMQGGGHNINPWTNVYSLDDLMQACTHLVDAAKQCPAKAIDFDLVDMVRELLLTGPAACHYDCMVKGIQSNDTQTVSNHSEQLQEILADVDTLLNTNQGFQLGSWLELASTLGKAIDAEDQLIWNAKSQVTLWEPYTDAVTGLPGLSDYATKIWAGLIREYQAPRIKMIAEQAMQDISAGRAFNSTAALITTLKAAVVFENSGWNQTALPAIAQGDAVSVSDAMIKKYSSQLQCTC